MPNLNPRERLLLGIALPAICLAAFYKFAWLPLDAARTDANDTIAGYRQIIATAAALPAPDNAPRAASPSGPLSARITQSADAAGLTVRRLEPEGTRLRISFDDTAFDRLISWIAEIEATEGARVVAADLSRRPGPGTVTAQLTLEDAR